MSKKRRLIKIKRRHGPGSVPGQIVSPRHAHRSTIHVMAYGPDDFVEKPDTDLKTIRSLRGKYPVMWINVEEFGDAAMISEIGELFGLHRLALEDSINTHQRPKAEEYNDHLFIVARMLAAGGKGETEQVAFFVGDGYLITFQEFPGDSFDPIRNRIRQGRGRIRQSGSDYLCYGLIDSIVDGYFPMLERYGELLENLEDAVVGNPTPEHVGELHDMKRDLLMLRRAIWPHREMINNLIREEHHLISPDTRPFLRDCYDHTIQLMDIVETYREIASGLIDVYMSSVSVKLNEVMKVLTIVATIFMPLSFIASLYGMNFDRTKSGWNMPELGWYYGYPYAIALMAASAAGLILYSWRKGWLFEHRAIGHQFKRPLDKD